MHLFVIHTKLKMLSSFTLPQVVPNLNEFLFFSAEHKRRYFECYQYLFSYYGSQWLRSTV